MHTSGGGAHAEGGSNLSMNMGMFEDDHRDTERQCGSADTDVCEGMKAALFSICLKSKRSSYKQSSDDIGEKYM